jgi:hypothetical protein
MDLLGLICSWDCVLSWLVPRCSGPTGAAGLEGAAGWVAAASDATLGGR